VASMSETQSLTAEFIKDQAALRVLWKSFENDALCTSMESFFSQSGIVREEALFQGINSLLSGSAEIPVRVRRANIRSFCQSPQKAADLGPSRVFISNGLVILKKKNPCFERGFSLLIKEPGLYTLNRVTIEVCEGLNSMAEGGGCFYTRLPLVMRRCLKTDCIVKDGKKITSGRLYKSDERKKLISAVDILGTAAFIGPEGLVAGLGFPSAAASSKNGYHTVRINITAGGINV